MSLTEEVAAVDPLDRNPELAGAPHLRLIDPALVSALLFEIQEGPHPAEGEVYREVEAWLTQGQGGCQYRDSDVWESADDE